MSTIKNQRSPPPLVPSRSLGEERLPSDVFHSGSPSAIDSPPLVAPVARSRIAHLPAVGAAVHSPGPSSPGIVPLGSSRGTPTPRLDSPAANARRESIPRIDSGGNGGGSGGVASTSASVGTTIPSDYRRMKSESASRRAVSRSLSQTQIGLPTLAPASTSPPLPQSSVPAASGPHHARGRSAHHVRSPSDLSKRASVEALLAGDIASARDAANGSPAANGSAGAVRPNRASLKSPPIWGAGPGRASGPSAGLAYANQRSTATLQQQNAKRAAAEADAAAEFAQAREELHRRESARIVAEQAALVSAHERRQRESEAAKAAADAEARFLNDYANFPPARLTDEPFTEAQIASLLAFLQHPDCTLLSATNKAALSLETVPQLYDAASHLELDMLLVHLRHLDLTGAEFPNLAALKVGVDFAENFSEEHGAGAPLPVPEDGVKGPANHGGSYAIRRKIWLYLRRVDVTIYPQVTWAEVEQLFVATMAGPRLGSILYRLDQIGVAFPTFAALLAHVSEIYARKASQHQKNCETLLAFLRDHQEAIYQSPSAALVHMTTKTPKEDGAADDDDADDAARPRRVLKSLALFLAPLEASLALVKKMLELGLGLSTLLYLLEAFLLGRLQFASESSLLAELKRAFTFLRAAVKKTHAFLASEPRGGAGGASAASSSDAQSATSGACVLALGPAANSGPPARRRTNSTSGVISGPSRKATFLSNVTLADAERLVRESGVLQYAVVASVPGATGGAGTDAADDQVLHALIQLNTQVDLQIKPPYTSLDALIADVRTVRASRRATTEGGQADEDDDDPIADEAEDAARERRRKARARKRAKAVATLLAALRAFLLSSDAGTLNCEKTGLVITDEELQGLLACGGGTFESVRGHCRQLFDQGIFVSTLAELRECVEYSHTLAVEQRKEHRRIIFDAARDAGLLDPRAFPSTLPEGAPADAPREPPEYDCDVDPATDAALDALLYFNALGQHPFPAAQALRTNYFQNPLATMRVLAFIFEILQEQQSLQQGIGGGSHESEATSVTAVEQGEDSAQVAAPSPSELRVRSLTLLLHSVHSVYTSYLHAKKQVVEYLHSSKCDLVLMGVPSSGEDAAGNTAAPDESAALAPPSSVSVNLLAQASMVEVEDLFEGAHVGLKVLPYLMELSYAPPTSDTGSASPSPYASFDDDVATAAALAAGAAKTFDEWADLKRALATIHARKHRARLAREAARVELRAYLLANECRILRPTATTTTASATRASSDGSSDGSRSGAAVEWGVQELDRVLDTCGGSLSRVMVHLRSLNTDTYVSRRLHTLDDLIDHLRTQQRAATRHLRALRSLMASRAGRDLLPSVAGVLGPIELDRIYVESGASDQVLVVLRGFIQARSTFTSLDDLLVAVREARTVKVRTDNRDQMILSSFFVNASESLFATSVPRGPNGSALNDGDIAAVYGERGSAPFSLLLLALSSLTVSGRIFDTVDAMREEAHARHTALVRDYTRSLAYLTRGDVLHRIFDTEVVAARGPTPDDPLPFTQPMVLALFERLEAAVLVHPALEAWEREGRRFSGWNELTKNLVARKADADRRTRRVEATLEQRHQLRALLKQHALLSEAAVANVPARDLDGLLSLELGGPGQTFNALDACFRAMRAEALPLRTFAQIARVVQVEIDEKPEQFVRVVSTLDANEAAAEAAAAAAREQEEKARAQQLAATTDEDEDDAPPTTTGRRYLLSPATNSGLEASSTETEAEETDVEMEVEAAHSSSTTQVGVMPSQQHSRFVLFTPDATVSSVLADVESESAAGGGVVDFASLRSELVEQLFDLADRQPWLEGAEDETTDSMEVIDARAEERRYTLFCALAWPRCHLLRSGAASSASSAAGLLDDHLDQMIQACGGGAHGLEQAVELVGLLDAEGRQFARVDQLVQALASTAQRRDLVAYLSTFGGLLANLLRTSHVLDETFVDEVVRAATSAMTKTSGTGEAAPLDPLLPIAHVLARTHAFFESERADAEEKVRAYAEAQAQESNASVADEANIDAADEAQADVTDEAKTETEAVVAAGASASTVEASATASTAADAVTEAGTETVAETGAEPVEAGTETVAETAAEASAEAAVEVATETGAETVEAGAEAGTEIGAETTEAAAEPGAESNDADAFPPEPEEATTNDNIAAASEPAPDAIEASAVVAPAAAVPLLVPPPSVPEVTLARFLATLSHFALEARRGILRSLLMEGAPPTYVSLFQSHVPLAAQLTTQRIDTLLAAHDGSLAKVVRTLHQLSDEEDRARRFLTAQEMVDAALALANDQKSREKAEAAAGPKDAADAAARERAALAAQEAEEEETVAALVAASVAAAAAGQDDAEAAQCRSAVLAALQSPECRVFAVRRDPIHIADADLDELVQLGGGLAATLHYIARLDDAAASGDVGVQCTSYESLASALVTRRQFDQCAEFWSEAQNFSAAVAQDTAHRQACAEGGQAYRLFTRDPADVSSPLERDLFSRMVEATAPTPAAGAGGAVDPLCTPLAVLQALARRDAPDVVPTPLFATRDDLLAGMRRTAARLRRHALAAFLFDPTTVSGSGSGARLLALPPPPAALSVAAASSSSDESRRFCRWEGLSASEADSLLSACDDRLYLALRHARVLARGGLIFRTVADLRDALALAQQHFREEEASQRVAPVVAPAEEATTNVEAFDAEEADTADAPEESVLPVPSEFDPGADSDAARAEGDRNAGISSDAESHDASSTDAQFFADLHAELDAAAAAQAKRQATRDARFQAAEQQLARKRAIALQTKVQFVKSSAARRPATPSANATAAAAPTDDLASPRADGYLAPFDPDEADALAEPSLSHVTRRVEESWRVTHDESSLRDAFRAALGVSDVFAASGAEAPTFTDEEIDEAIALAHGDLSTFQSGLLSLERAGQRYFDATEVLRDLAQVDATGSHEEIMIALEYPGCCIFAECVEPVSIASSHLRSLLASCGRSVRTTKRCLRVLDEAHVRLRTAEELVATVRLLRTERRNIKNSLAEPEIVVISSATAGPQPKSILKKRAGSIASRTDMQSGTVAPVPRRATVTLPGSDARAPPSASLSPPVSPTGGESPSKTRRRLKGKRVSTGGGGGDDSSDLSAHDEEEKRRKSHPSRRKKNADGESISRTPPPLAGTPTPTNNNKNA